MKYSSSLVSLFILAALVLHCSADANLVRQTCNKFSKNDPNIKFGFCVAALQSDPSSRTASLEGLAFISLKLSMSKAKSFGPKIQGLLKDKKFDKGTKKILNGCLEHYSDASDELQVAFKDFEAKDYGKANVDLSAALDYGQNCEDDFREAGRVCPLAREDGDLFQLVAICLGFSKSFP
ncbi:hypothetical protein Ancab_032931 [Ancistrocladus abbreviatus]